jgi:hypothetical protein
MLKSKITKAEFDALADALKAVYKQDGDNYLLQSDDAAELRALLATERDERKRLETEKAQREAAEEAARQEAARVAAEAARKEAEAAEALARKNNDISALEASWAAKLEAAKKEGEQETQRLRTMLENVLVDKEAEALANKISTAPDLLKPAIKARLQADLTGDTPITRVLDAAGKPSAANLAELEQEIVANKNYAAIIISTNANGGGANGNGLGGGATSKKISEMTEAERIAAYKANPDAFNAQKAAEGYAY